ncbi:tetratricopeptide repeat-containing sulfotransferase family protein [Rehaibacterium terrae]|uniref:Tetratricopeptide (TPR) repeat protein n=1 Tax=Rehaibacterium terrae TaxID=1341696 RepID=A0A7W7XZ48_9GAMM|nr:sulfotransferase [Rehaibacterium terrae]MBB5015117.1 tetratricopeptide (TPR) repeat protein [Rehaibacterium terrae]
MRRLLQRAETYRASGQLADAIANYEACTAIVPDHVPALLGLAELHLEAGAHNPAREAALRALSGHMDSPRTVLRLMETLNVLSESTLMVQIAAQLPPPLWDSAQSLAQMAYQLSLIGAHDLAREFARAGVARDPNHPPSLYVHATLDVFFGDIESAAEHAERCIAILPGDPGSHWLLSRLRQPDAGRRIDRIRRELARAPDAEATAYLAYALHNELHDQRDYAAAWDALVLGCRAKRSTLDYSIEAAGRLFDALMTWSEEDLAVRDGWEEGPFDPVFVIGLHRSGTTLAERILGGHSLIRAGGETYDLRAQLRRASGRHFQGELDPAVVEARSGFDYRAIGEGYITGMRWRGAGKPLVTDKLPSNYYNVGFIARALPRARFIHLRRDPVDVGLSSLRTLFSHACPYSYDQLEFVAHYRRYQALMQHWRDLLGDRILDVDYDDLVQNPEATSAAMARFCGVAYEPGMLAIEARKDAVSTASSVMMRDGIRRDRGRIWQAYERQLSPMIEAVAAG